jgi:DNA-binding NarL/FixJ family response regulator
MSPRKEHPPDELDPIEAGARRLNLTLSPTLRYVLAMVCAGRSNEEIAAELNVAERTAKNYVSSLLGMAKVDNRAALIAEVLAGKNNVQRAVTLAKKAWVASPRRGAP